MSGDHILFTKKSANAYMAVLVYVGDIFIASSCDKAMDILKAALQCSFKLHDLGIVRYFLGLKISCSGITLFQKVHSEFID